MRLEHLPVEMGVLEDLTITSATSIIGIALLLPLGGVGNVDGPGEGAENILLISTMKVYAPNHSHPDRFSDTFETTECASLL